MENVFMKVVKIVKKKDNFYNNINSKMIYVGMKVVSVVEKIFNLFM